MVTRSDVRADVVVLTAIDLEYAAVRAHLTGLRPAGRAVWTGRARRPVCTRRYCVKDAPARTAERYAGLPSHSVVPLGAHGDAIRCPCRRGCAHGHRSGVRGGPRAPDRPAHL